MSTSPSNPTARSPDTPAAPGATDWRLIALFVAIVILGIVFTLYASGSGSGFVYDDV